LLSSRKVLTVVVVKSSIVYKGSVNSYILMDAETYIS